MGHHFFFFRNLFFSSLMSGLLFFSCSLSWAFCSLFLSLGWSSSGASNNLLFASTFSYFLDSRMAFTSSLFFLSFSSLVKKCSPLIMA